MKQLIKLITENEDWLIVRVLDYAQKLGYTTYAGDISDRFKIKTGRA